MSLAPMLGPLLPSDPTGFNSPVARLIVLVALVAFLIVLLRWWWNQRKR